MVAGGLTAIHWPVSSVAFSFGGSALEGACGIPDPVPCDPSPGLAAALVLVSAVLVAGALWAGLLVALPSARRRAGRALLLTLVAVALVQVLVVLAIVM